MRLQIPQRRLMEGYGSGKYLRVRSQDRYGLIFVAGWSVFWHDRDVGSPLAIERKFVSAV
jgi:hypothetical protein